MSVVMVPFSLCVYRMLSFFEWFHRFQPGNPLHSLLKTDPRSNVNSLVVVLNESEFEQMEHVIKRAERLAEAAKEHKVRLMIDAEQTYFQPAIRHIAVNVLMPQYNLTTPIIYNTVQSYLKVGEAHIHWSCISPSLYIQLLVT